MKKERKVIFVLCILYSILLTWIILFKMQFSIHPSLQMRNINLIPYAQSVIVNGKMDYQEIVYNIIAFIPLGVFFSSLKPNWAAGKKIVIIGALSLIYEALQYLLAIGATDITDLIDNTLGGAIGVLIYCIFLRIFREKTDKVILMISGVCMLLLVGILGLLIITNW